ncbi:MAG: DTW domain-containing protein [Oligoflexia bacterium]|nr:DTW domain-containing protein [Oligoflexia bacterium]
MVNKNDYIQKKKDLEQKFLVECENTHRKWCFTCRRPKKNCLCQHMEPFDTHVKIILLMHPKEAKKQRVGTGRMTAAILKNSEVIMGVDFTDSNEFNQYLDKSKYLPLLLYPGDSAFNLSESKITDWKYKEEYRKRIPVIFVLDGTWPCAKKMIKLSKNLRELPRICFSNSKPSEFVIKHQPHEDCLSTIESVHLLLNELNESGLESFDKKHDNLIYVFKKLVEFQLKCSQDPDMPSYRGKKRGLDQNKAKVRYKTHRSFFLKEDWVPDNPTGHKKKK